jgi:hypothetical protein
MNIAAKFQEIFIFLYEDGLVTSLKQMTTPTMTAIEIDRVGGIEALHEFIQVGLWGLEKEMKMVVHNYKGMQVDSEKSKVGGEDFEKLGLIRAIPEDVPFLIAPAGDVIPSSRIFDAKRSGHS